MLVVTFLTRAQTFLQFAEYKAPEKVYKKWTPNKTAQGKAFTGVSPSKFGFAATFVPNVAS